MKVLIIGTGQRTTTRVRLVDRLGPEDEYDLAVVIVRRNQVASVLPMLAQAHRIPSVLFLGNSATGPEHLVNALGKDRVLTGMVNAGGERERDTGWSATCGGRPCPWSSPNWRVTAVTVLGIGARYLS
jgi:ketopantoate reductase